MKCSCEICVGVKGVRVDGGWSVDLVMLNYYFSYPKDDIKFPKENKY